MAVLTQKEAVFQAVDQVLTNAGLTTETESAKSQMTKELRAQVNQILFAGFKAGTIELNEEKDDKSLKSYVSGLQSNWLNKDKRLNGDVKYVAKNPGSRTGSGDPQIKALRALLTTKSGEEADEIEGYIQSRLAEIATAKPKKNVTVDFSALPAELAAKYATV